LSEYVYDLLWNYPLEDRKKIHRRYWMLMTDAKRARNFADYSTLEEKMLLFKELNIECALVFTQEKLKNTNSLKRVLSLYQEEKNAGAVREASNLQVFVSSDRDMSFLLGMISQTIHHKSYYLNMQMNKVGYSIKNWEKNQSTHDGKELKDLIDMSELIDKTILNSIINSDSIHHILGINPLDLRILIFLNLYKHTYLAKDFISSNFIEYTKVKVGSSLKRLLLNDYIIKHPKLTDNKYTISGKGISAVGDFRKIVLKSNQF
jgi:hypothetical protein